jgi:hypothetical protein
MHTRAARFLELTLLFNLLIHGAAVLTMGLLLLPGLPGGPNADPSQRMEYLAANATLWRLGWVPWHLCALIDVITGIALLFTPWVPRLPALATLLVTLLAVIPEQMGEFLWITLAVELAQTGQIEEFLLLETRAFHLTVVVGASLYILMALGWTWSLAAARTWNSTMTWLSIAAWGTLSIGSVGLLLPEPIRPSELTVALTNAIGFPLLLVWLALATELVARRSRPNAASGKMMPWRHPGSGILARLWEWLAESRLIRMMVELLPAPQMRSDIEAVISINYLVDADRVEAMLPEGLQLQRLGPQQDKALLSVLTFRHGNFRPAMLNWLRSWFPSPMQSNWRIYVREKKTNLPGVFFFTTATASTGYALLARFGSEGHPMHVPQDMAGTFAESVNLRLTTGAGTSPDLQASLTLGEKTLPETMQNIWGDWREFVAYAVGVERALSAQPWYDRITAQEVALGIDLDSIQALQGNVSSHTLTAIVGRTQAVSFRVPKVGLRFLGERAVVQ